jgi:hypothetical protein
MHKVAAIQTCRGHVGILDSCSGGPGSNISPVTGYRDLGFSWFASVHPGKC